MLANEYNTGRFAGAIGSGKEEQRSFCEVRRKTRMSHGSAGHCLPRGVTPATVTVAGSKEAHLADVFISYSQKRRDLTKNLAAALQGFGYEVWWDESLEGGQRFDDEIRQELDKARAVIVIWTQESATSRYVLMEAGIAYGWSKLITSHSPEFDKGLMPNPFVCLNSIPVTDLEKVRRALDALKVKPTGAMEMALRNLNECDPGLRKEFEAWKPKCESKELFVRAHPTLTLTVRCYVGRKAVNLASISNATLYMADFCGQRIATETPKPPKDICWGCRACFLVLPCSEMSGNSPSTCDAAMRGHPCESFSREVTSGLL